MLDSSSVTGSVVWVSSTELQWVADGSSRWIVLEGNFTDTGSDFLGTITSIYLYPGGKLQGSLQGVSIDYQANKSAIEVGNVHDLLQAAMSGNDVVSGSNGNDVLAGHAGADKIDGYNGEDHIEGGAGDDQLAGWFGADVVYGQDGNDTILDEWVEGRDPVAFQVFRLYQATLDRAPDAAGHNNWTNAVNSGMPIQAAVKGFVNSTEFQSKYGATNNRDFVDLLYNNVLNRAASVSERAAWENALNNGMSRENVVLRFSDSTEFTANTKQAFLPFSTVALAGDLSDDVYRLYRSILDREPDSEGLFSWTVALASGRKKSDVVSGFMDSTEFQAKYGSTTNGEFVGLLYNNVLERAADASERAAWVNALNNGMSRENVVLRFADSAEFIANTTPDMVAFTRSPTMADHNDTLNGGADDDSLVGSVGADTFEFVQGEGGTDLVGDFEAWDWVSFDGFGYSLASDVTTQMTQTADGAEFSDQGQTILFWGIEVSDFTSDNFIFV